MSHRVPEDLFRLGEAHLVNYRGFEQLDLALEPDLTVIYAVNGGGKTTALRGLAALLGAWFTPIPGHLWSTSNASSIIRQIRTPSGAWEPAGAARLDATGVVGGRPVSWQHRMNPNDARNLTKGLSPLRSAASRVRQPGRDWPLLASYGTQRLWGEVRATQGKNPEKVQRSDGYIDCLDPRSSEVTLLNWVWREAVADDRNRREGRALRGFEQALCEALSRATLGVSAVRYDLGPEELRVEFDDGREVGWYQLSDGYHVFMGLVADIARRSILLNDHLGAQAPLETQGVVLIDEIDLHLHPRWQVAVVDGLRRAFPRLQFVVSTHSALVLSSVENRQVRRLESFQVAKEPQHVQGRDANSIFRESYSAMVRARIGEDWLGVLHTRIDAGDVAGARALMADLRERWGPTDADLSYAEALLDWREA
jgi:predicted ATP-binding protein involved in virulence